MLSSVRPNSGLRERRKVAPALVLLPFLFLGKLRAEEENIRCQAPQITRLSDSIRTNLDILHDIKISEAI